ncbi:MAG TPA: hypothetical protein VNK04_01595 [Gemmataceae bacterium]|nr:hypothetical protein [Gemmataceae bacterium]
MTHAASPGHEHAPAAGQPYFSAVEWEALQADDRKAGMAVVGLMMAIFTIGLFLYLGVALVVMTS